jgi:hypothetical protein
MSGGSPELTSRRPLAILSLWASASWLAYAAIASCGQSLHEAGPRGHSLPAILALFGLAFGCYPGFTHHNE